MVTIARSLFSPGVSGVALGIYLYQLGGTLIFEVFRDPFSDSKTREKDEAKKAREREPSSPTGDRRARPPAAWGLQSQAFWTAAAYVKLADRSKWLS